MPLFVRLFCLFACCSAFSAEALFESGRWNAAVVMSAEPEPDEWYTAHALVDWCERVTGHRPELLEESAGSTINRRGIFIGKTHAAQQAGIAAPAIEGDAATCRTKNGSVFLLGNNPTATRIAVGRFCEKSLGIFFAFPGPRGADWIMLSQVPLPMDDEFRPAFAWREIGGIRNELSQEWAFSIGYGRAPSFSHGLYAAFGKKDFAEDPTLFASVHGVRQPPSGTGYDANPNLAHPRAPELGARQAREWFHKHPDDFCVPLGVNDSLKFDDAAPSTGWYRERPVRTDYVVRYLNEVAKSFWQPAGDLKGERHAIGTLAYLQTLKAPSIPVDPAIFPWVCSDRMGYASAEFAEQESANLRAWVKSGARRVGAYDYWYGVDYTVPRANFTAQALSIRTANSAGVRGWYAELAPLWGFDAPKAWLGAKLLERPELEGEALLSQWFDRAYGPAAEPMREAYRTIEAAWARDAQTGGANQWIRHFRSEDSAEVLNDAERAAIGRCLSAATSALAASDKETFRLRNQRWRLQQFTDAWELSQSFRAVHQARQPDTRSPVAALTGLQRLIKSESAFLEQQKRFNIAWGAYGLPVHWLEFIPKDPRGQRVRAAFERTAQREELEATVANDRTGLSVLDLFWLTHADEAKTLAAPKSSDALFEEWNFQRSNNQRSVLRAGEGLLRVERDFGSLTRTLPISESQLIKLSVRLNPTSPADEVRIGLTFKGSGKPLTRTVRCGAREGTLILPAPKGATEVEFSIVFENGIGLTSLEAEALPLRR